MLVRGASRVGRDGSLQQDGRPGSPPATEPKWGSGTARCMCPRVPRSAGSSPHPSLTEEDDSQTELLIAEEKLSPEQEGQLMPR